MKTRPGDVLTIFPDGTIVGQPRISYETTPEGAFMVRVSADVERPCGPLCKTDRHRIDPPPNRAGHVDCVNACTKRIDCGGSCCRDRGHEGECECIGDDPGRPGTCPA